MSTSKIRIKMGPIEVEYEGSEAFLKEELPELLKAVSELHKTGARNCLEIPHAAEAEPVQSRPVDGQRLQMTTANIATRLSTKTGTDLIIAACAKLSLVDNKDKYTRTEILTEMKNASSYYKKTFAKNMTPYLKTLTGSKLNEITSDTYALRAETLRDLQAKLC
jgi:hypothetical protein